MSRLDNTKRCGSVARNRERKALRFLEPPCYKTEASESVLLPEAWICGRLDPRRPIGYSEPIQKPPEDQGDFSEARWHRNKVSSPARERPLGRSAMSVKTGALRAQPREKLEDSPNLGRRRRRASKLGATRRGWYVEVKKPRRALADSLFSGLALGLGQGLGLVGGHGVVVVLGLDAQSQSRPGGVRVSEAWE